VTAPPVAPATASRPVTPVGILAATLAEVCQRLDGVDPDLAGDIRRAHALAAGLDPYLGACTTPESPALRRLAERTRGVEGQTLKFLVHLTRSRRVLDIGMFTGYSALAMAEALPADGVVVACEVDQGVAEFARRCFAESTAGSRIDVRLGSALDTLAALAATGEGFDLVFIDADKAGYVDYLDAVLATGLLADGGVVCVDNTLMQGQPYLSPEATPNGLAIANFNRAVAADPRVEQVLLPLRDGLTLIRRAGAAPGPASREG